VSHVVHDHTSILRLVETKWNLGAMTWRDANADNLLDMVDLAAAPAFAEPPTLPPPSLVTHPSTCALTGPGQIPPPDAVTPAPTAGPSGPAVEGSHQSAGSPAGSRSARLPPTGSNDRRAAIGGLAALGAALALRRRLPPEEQP